MSPYHPPLFYVRRERHAQALLAVDPRQQAVQPLQVVQPVPTHHRLEPARYGQEHVQGLGFRV
jgi:hypothetical protein